jgi:hypothetical protein
MVRLMHVPATEQHGVIEQVIELVEPAPLRVPACSGTTRAYASQNPAGGAPKSSIIASSASGSEHETAGS